MMTRLMYLFLMILGVVLSGVFLSPSVYESMSKKTGVSIGLLEMTAFLVMIMSL